MASEVFKNETKQINRRCAIIDSELKKRTYKVVIIDPKSDKCSNNYGSSYHQGGCNI